MLLAAALGPLGFAGDAARAAPLPFAGELEIFLGATRLSANASGTALVQPGGSFAVGAGLFPLVADVPSAFPFPALGPVDARITGALGAGSFAPGGGPDGGFGALFLGFQGTARLELRGVPAITTLVSLVLLGNGGTWTLPPIDLSTLTGAWTTAASVRVFTLGPGVTSTLTLQGFDARTPGGRGTLRMNAPVTVIRSSLASFPLHATLTLTFVPEPGTATLLLAGATGLALFGRRRRRAPAP